MHPKKKNSALIPEGDEFMYRSAVPIRTIISLFPAPPADII